MLSSVSDGRAPGHLRSLAADQRGQAMVEYSSIFMAMCVVGLPAFVFLMPQLMNALNTYLNSVYYVLNLPLP
jgi:hypothetical protein